MKIYIIRLSNHGGIYGVYQGKEKAEKMMNFRNKNRNWANRLTGNRFYVACYRTED